MLAWLGENLATILISILLIGIVAAIIVKLYKEKGKSSCGAGCAHCAMHGSCRKK